MVSRNARRASVVSALSAAVVVAGCSSGPDPDETATKGRDAVVYGAVVRAFLADAPDALESPSTLYVLDRAFERAGVGDLTGQSEPIGGDVQQEVSELLAAEAELSWIADESAVLHGRPSHAIGPCVRVRDGDAVVTLDVLGPQTDRLEVSVSATGHELSARDCAVTWLNT